MVALVIRQEGSQAFWRVWPDPEGIPAGTIAETRHYLFELRGAPEAAAADLLIDDLPLEALRTMEPETARWRWSPGFHAGTVEAELRLPGSGIRRFDIVTDADARKLSRTAFDTMVREILEDTFALFSLASFRAGIARGSGGRPPAIARLEFLRSRITELEDVADAIATRPRRVLTAEETSQPYHRALRASGPEILRSFRSGRILTETAMPSRLPPALRGHLPARIRVRERRSSLDLPEHRQMAACLRSWGAWLGVAADTLSQGGFGEEDTERRRTVTSWASRCQRLARRISRLGALPPFTEAGEAPPRLALSALFRNDPVYRRFYVLYQDINRGIAAVFGDFLQMPLARTFELYELWCYLRLVRAAVEEYGPTGLDTRDLFIADAAGGVTIAAGAVTVEVGAGWKLCFQKSYREFWIEPDRLGSFSRAMEPDIVLRPPAGSPDVMAPLIVLDAKYRIESGLGAALTSIHTYRDALVHEAASGMIEGVVSAAYILAPHIPELETGFRDTPMPGRLFHPEYRRSFRFGAMTMRPGMTTAEVVDVLKAVVSDATA